MNLFEAAVELIKARDNLRELRHAGITATMNDVMRAKAWQTIYLTLKQQAVVR